MSSLNPYLPTFLTKTNREKKEKRKRVILSYMCPYFCKILSIDSNIRNSGLSLCLELSPIIFVPGSVHRVGSTSFFSSSGPKDPMSLCHGVASVIRPSVLPSVRPSVRPSFRPSVRPSVLPSFRPSVRPQFSKCFFFVISQPILILIVS